MGTYRKDSPLKTLVSSCVNGDSNTYFVIRRQYIIKEYMFFNICSGKEGGRHLMQERMSLPPTSELQGARGHAWALQETGRWV